MVSAAKAFSKEPPKRPLDCIDAVVEDFRWRYADRHKTDQVVEYCRQAPTFAIAVARAVESRDALGKHHNHQSKVDIRARRVFGRSIVAQKGKLSTLLRHAKRMYGAGKSKESPFDVLHDFLDDIKPYGIGPVTVYDVATRLAAYLGEWAEPTSVYMHAGVKQGMKALEEAVWPGDDLYKLKRVPMSTLKQIGFADSKADEVEDILCTYREVFLGWQDND